jgi:DNA ligase (NAD+)
VTAEDASDAAPTSCDRRTATDGGEERSTLAADGGEERSTLAADGGEERSTLAADGGEERSTLAADGGDAAGNEDAPTDNPFVRSPDTDFEPVDSLDESAAREQAEALREAIEYHDYRYYVRNDPVISDRAYDALFDRLLALEDAFDLDVAGSPTNRVGGEPVDHFDTVSHVAPMLSIDSADDPEDVRAFDERVREAVGDVSYVLEPKFDGVSLEVVYEDGELERATTRGDGEEGDDVTRNARTISALPQRLRGDPPEFLAVRGEVYMPREAFTAYNTERVERGDEPFANPRNATAGTLRQQDPSVVAERPLSIFFFDVLESSDPWDTHSDALDAFPELGLVVNDRVETGASIDDAIEYRDALLDERDDLDYEVDGVVVKVDDREQREELGATARAYRWAIAYKFPARTEQTPVANITVQVGRTGRLTPVALLEPVDVGGVTVSRASLHNFDEVEALGVGVGDVVRVQRAGDVIPYVAEVVEHHSDGHFELPDACPVCSSPVERDGPMAYCTGGLGCRAQLERSVEYYASEKGLDVEGLGEETVTQLVDAGLVSDGVADLYEITEDDLLALEGWGETSANNLLDELEATTEPPLADFLAALGIQEVGPELAGRIARDFETFDAVRDAAERGDVDALAAVDGVGDTVATQVVDFFQSDANRAVLDDLLAHVSPQAAEGVAGDELDGLTFVFTGSLSAPRSDFEDVIEAHGGSATGSVSSNTDYLVVGENPGATKREDADAEGVPTIDEEELAEVLDSHGVDEWPGATELGETDA